MKTLCKIVKIENKSAWVLFIQDNRLKLIRAALKGKDTYRMSDIAKLYIGKKIYVKGVV